MKTPLVSFFSDIEGRTYYSDHAKRFIKNCRDLDMPFIVRELQSKGDYRLNCLSKPKFIYEMMKEINTPFVWMDIDSYMHKQLNVFDDFAANADIGMAFPKAPTKEDQTMSLPKASPIFVNNTAVAIEFLKKWVDAAEEVKSSNTPIFDHEILIALFVKNTKAMRIACLPLGYCIWPGTEHNGEKYITMGLADGESKASTLKQLGFSDELIAYQSVGSKFI